MEIPPNVVLIDETPELELYHYNDEAEHPGPASFWKGIVTDGNRVVARSFAWAPTVEETVVPEGHIYTSFYEATLIRFYRYDGKPMASTHRRINIMETNSRVGTGRPFKDLINVAIKNWPYHETIMPHPELDDENVLITPPTSWEDMCVEGYCHVFLLLDWSNQITNLNSTVEECLVGPDTASKEIDEFIVDSSSEAEEVVTFQVPKLIHVLTFKFNPETNSMDPVPAFLPITKMETPDPYSGANYKLYSVPIVPRLVHEQAEQILAEGGAVVGFDPANPDITTKYYSPEYARKVQLAGETFNPIYRWFELMDQSPEEAREYLKNLPSHHRDKDWSYMVNIHDEYLHESAKYLGNTVFDRWYGTRASLDPRIWVKTSNIVNGALDELGRLYDTKKVPKEVIRTASYKVVRDLIAKSSYKEQHSIHGAIMRVSGGH